MTTVVQAAPDEARSTALALRLTGNRLGQVAAPAAAGLLAGVAGAAAPFVMLGALLLIASGLGLRQGRTGAAGRSRRNVGDVRHPHRSPRDTEQTSFAPELARTPRFHGEAPPQGPPDSAASLPRAVCGPLASVTHRSRTTRETSDRGAPAPCEPPGVTSHVTRHLPSTGQQVLHARCLCGGEVVARRRARRVPGAARTLRLRQVDRAEDDRRPHGPHRGTGAARRRVRQPSGARRPGHGDDLPELRALPDHERPRQHRLPAAHRDARRGPALARRRHGRACSASRTSSTASPTSSPAANASASRWAGRSPGTPPRS